MNNIKFWVIKKKDEELYLFSHYDKYMNHEYIFSNEIRKLEQTRSNYSWSKEDAERKITKLQEELNVELEIISVVKKVSYEISKECEQCNQ